MNGIIAAHIAVEAMRDQFTYGDEGRPDTTPKRPARGSELIRTLRSLAARMGRRSHQAAREASGAR
jgi:hypothetical protein